MKLTHHNRGRGLLDRLLVGAAVPALATCLAAPIAFHATPVLAQVDEIIVQARKRDESIQDTPVIVYALDEEALERYGVNTIDDLGTVVPGLGIVNSGGAVQAQINIRGVDSGAIGVGLDQAVALNIDGVQVSNAEFIRSGQFDLERVEVLKGPQALFFGKNSPGGIISLVSAGPTDEFFAEGRIGYETASERPFGHAIVAGPVTDVLGVRLAASYTDSEGWFENTDPDVKFKNLPNFDELIVRGTVVYEPNEVFAATGKVAYSSQEGGDFFFSELIGCDPTSAFVQAFAPGEDCTLNFKGSTGDLSQNPLYDPSVAPEQREDPFSEYQNLVASLELDYAISDDLQLTSITGFTEIQNDRNDNLIPGRNFGLPFPGPIQLCRR